ncbi:MAG: hypothetical protein LBR52_04835 [Prevotellaceae bacterium]|jgi:hypothetical protein|nr:hypothetical protein [Prevotellaceae bacterium]
MSKKSLIIVLLWACIAGAYAQNNTSSPYTRYGYGGLVDAGFGQNKSMGGISFGLRSNRFTNPGNPASFTAIDSLTFRFEAAASLKFSSFMDANGEQSKTTGNLEYLAFQFPVKRWLGISAGLQPFSVVGYDFSNHATIQGSSLETTYLYSGSGGITQLYLGAAIEPVSNLSLGASVNLNFGTVRHSSSVSFADSLAYYPTTKDSRIRATSFSGLFGAQYTLFLPKEQKITIGAVFQPKTSFGKNAEQTIITTDTVNIPANNDFDMPMSYGAGFAYNLSKTFLAGFDYKHEAWSDVRYFGEKPFTNRNKFSLGVEYQPDNNGRSYFSRVCYRAGANYSNFYAKVNGKNVNEYGVSAGLGLPLKRGLNPTVLNLVFEYGNMGTKNDNLIKDQYFKFTLNMTINERWFMTRKFE